MKKKLLISLLFICTVCFSSCIDFDCDEYEHDDTRKELIGNWERKAKFIYDYNLNKYVPDVLSTNEKIDIRFKWRSTFYYDTDKGKFELMEKSHRYTYIFVHIGKESFTLEYDDYNDAIYEDMKIDNIDYRFIYKKK